MTFEVIEDGTRCRRQIGGDVECEPRRFEQGRQRRAHHERERCGTRRRDPPPAAYRSETFLIDGRVRAQAQAAPCHLACQAQVLEIGGVVEVDARREHVALPRRRRQLQSLQLRDHLRDAVALVQLRPRLHVLPAQQEAHEVGGGHRLDLLA